MNGHAKYSSSSCQTNYGSLEANDDEVDDEEEHSTLLWYESQKDVHLVGGKLPTTMEGIHSIVDDDDDGITTRNHRSSSSVLLWNRFRRSSTLLVVVVVVAATVVLAGSSSLLLVGHSKSHLTTMIGASTPSTTTTTTKTTPHTTSTSASITSSATTTTTTKFPLLFGRNHQNNNKKSRNIKKTKEKKVKKKKDKENTNTIKMSQWIPPKAYSRCEWVKNQFQLRDIGTPPNELKERYIAQSIDINIFYRATAHIFWSDFNTNGKWSNGGGNGNGNDDDGNGNFISNFLLHDDETYTHSNDEEEDDDKDEDSTSSSSSSSSSDDDDSKEEEKEKKKKKKKVMDEEELQQHVKVLDGAPLVPKSLWTWITGDQHLSNFGAWRNRHGDIVYGVNDFDEAAIYDFQMDVFRIAVSIYSHSISNGLLNDKNDNDENDNDSFITIFAMNYLSTILNYVDNEKALLFELTPKTATGKLQDFLQKTQSKKSSMKQMIKFTTKKKKKKISSSTPSTNTSSSDGSSDGSKRHFIKGPINEPHPDTSLATVPEDIELQLRQEFTKTKYGASMMKLGWAVYPWDDEFFTVLDVAERIGSGIGSYGVDRYYILLKGHDGLLLDNGEDGSAVILDVKYQPPSSVSYVLSKEETAWYHDMFPNEAARVVEAQRRLTSYTDPFTGWITLTSPSNGTTTSNTTTYERPYSVRQRSPWKDSPDLDSLTNSHDFKEYMSQIATATATSHVRGSVAKAPGDFKHVIATVFEKKDKRIEWSKLVTRVAHGYRKQVELDYECFRDYVHDMYNS